MRKITTFNRAISFSLLYKTWQASAGIATIPLVVRFLQPVAQGYYYTFASLIALQSFFELGLSIAISVYASHEWHRLHLDGQAHIAGEADSLSRLVSLGRFIFRYFGAVSLAYLFCAGSAGFYILGKGQEPTLEWVLPWFLHVAFSAGYLWLMPFLSLLEGCNQVAAIASFRFTQSVISSAALWIALAMKLNLWSMPIASGISFIAITLYLGLVKKRFFKPFYSAPTSKLLSWKDDLLQMQWRLAVQGLFSYLSFPLYTVLIYRYFGAVEAGRVGMTLQVIAGVQSFALVFMIARAPEFALLAASGQSSSLFSHWKRASILSLGVMASTCTLIILCLLAALNLGLPQVSRMLPISSFVVLAVGAVLAGVIQCIAVYLRAYRRELLTPVGVIAGFCYGLSAWLVCVRFGSSGLSASYLVVTGLVALPLTLLVLRANYPRMRQQVA